MFKKGDYASNDDDGIMDCQTLDLSGLCPEYRCAVEVMIKYCQDMKQSLQNAQLELTKSRREIYELENQIREKDVNYGTKIDDLRKEIDYKTEELNDLKNQLSQITDSEQKERHRVSILQSSFEEAKDECLRIRTTLENVMLSHSQLQHGVEILETELANKDVKLAKLSQEKVDGQEMQKVLTNKLEELKKKVSTLAEEEQKDSLQLKKTIRQLKENNARLASTVHSTLQENTELRKKLQQAEERLSMARSYSNENNGHQIDDEKCAGHWRTYSFDRSHQKDDFHSIGSCPRLLENMSKCFRSGDNLEVVESEECLNKLKNDNNISQTDSYEAMTKLSCDKNIGDSTNELNKVHEYNYAKSLTKSGSVSSLTASAMNKVEAITEKAQRALENTQKTMNRLSMYMETRDDIPTSNFFQEEIYDTAEFNSQIQYHAGDSDEQHPMPVPRISAMNSFKQSMTPRDLLPKRFLLDNNYSINESPWRASSGNDLLCKGQKAKN